MSDAIEQPRRGDWMQTFTGRAFWPVDPRADELDIEDIAHALSMMCRYAGHCLRFYSVAEHSVLMARAVPRQDALWALLHDATEAYVVDVPRPLKPYLPGYKQAEAAVLAAVAVRFGLRLPMPEAVKDADNRILHDESQQNMAAPPRPWTLPDAPPLGVELQFWPPERAEAEFLATFHSLTGGGR